MELATEMIGHRSSVFEGNSLVFMKDHGILIGEAHELPKGFRATWEDRGKLAGIKAVGDLRPGTSKAEYERILLKDGAKPADDQQFPE